jgi:hypothetical protein
MEVDLSRLLYEVKQVKLRVLYMTATLCSNTIKGTSCILQHDWLCDGVFLYAVIDHKTDSWTEQVSVVCEVNVCNATDQCVILGKAEFA